MAWQGLDGTRIKVRVMAVLPLADWQVSRPVDCHKTPQHAVFARYYPRWPPSRTKKTTAPRQGANDDCTRPGSTDDLIQQWRYEMTYAESRSSFVFVPGHLNCFTAHRATCRDPIWVMNRLRITGTWLSDLTIDNMQMLLYALLRTSVASSGQSAPLSHNLTS